jgi:hypothetical protein
MKIKLLNGNFESWDAIQLITSMIEVKIKYHESKINHSSREEDIKMRENRIQHLQKDLQEIRTQIGTSKRINLHAEIEVENP